MLPEILYQDGEVLVINKPPGLLSVPDGYDASLPHVRSVLQDQFNLNGLWMAHRLDKETSGVMVLAKNAERHRQLNANFRNREVKKSYHGLVTPAPPWQQKDIHLSLRVNADRQHRTRVDHTNGKKAQSACRVLKRFSLGVLMQIDIQTGITHHIRAHLRAIDLMLIGESLYNAGLPTPHIHAPRMMLHARQLWFPGAEGHPPIDITAPYFEDFRQCLTTLRVSKDPNKWP